MLTDTFKTIGSPSEGIYKEKGSKFIALAFPVSDESQIKEILIRLRKEHHAAKHHCYAWKLENETPLTRINDDGEPSGTAGRPIFNVIQKYNLSNILIVVVRYFGGILLGTSGLTNAYKIASDEAIQKAVITEKILTNNLVAHFKYSELNDFMLVVKEQKLDICDCNYNNDCVVTVQIRKSQFQSVVDKLNMITSIKLKT